MFAADSTAAALVKLGDGVAGLRRVQVDRVELEPAQTDAATFAAVAADQDRAQRCVGPVVQVEHVASRDERERHARHSGEQRLRAFWSVSR